MHVDRVPRLDVERLTQGDVHGEPAEHACNHTAVGTTDTSHHLDREPPWRWPGTGVDPQHAREASMRGPEGGNGRRVCVPVEKVCGTMEKCTSLYSLASK